MRAAARLALYGAGLVVAFGGAYAIAGAVAPDGAAEAWAQGTRADEHGESTDHEGAGAMDEQRHGGEGSAVHDHPSDGGAPPAGIRAEADPSFPLGATVRLSADHMPGMDGAEATISGAFDTTAYAVSYTPTDGGEPVHDHEWVVHEELDGPGAAPLAEGAEAIVLAEHMPGMRGATATVDRAVRETVYMVDIASDEMTATRHKWVVESEIRPLG